MSEQTLSSVLNSVLGLNRSYQKDTLLLGAIPELDSATIIALIVTLEDQFGIQLNDDEISAELFTSFGSLWSFIAQKIQ
jgi:acyl carrier protein